MNPVMMVLGESWDSHDGHAVASEWLFQMCRLWTEFQSPQVGTCPVEYRDPTGPVEYEQALASGEDGAYWDSVMALLEAQGCGPKVWDGDEAVGIARAWREGVTPKEFDAGRAGREVVVAFHSVHRLYRLTDTD